MQVAIYLYQGTQFEKHPKSDSLNEKQADLVLCFGSKELLKNKGTFSLLKNKFPAAAIAMCSTSGEIHQTSVHDDSLSVTAIQFAGTSVHTHSIEIGDFNDSYEAGRALMKKFDPENLCHVLVLSDGSRVNGSELVRGINSITHEEILVTGGLAGDGSNFHSTLVGINDHPREGLIAGIGFYGDKLKVSHGSKGGWEMFGLEKEVTKSINNVLFEIENKNALELYKQYLGPEAATLPGSALLFPLAVTLPGQQEPIVRTILSLDDAAGSMTFAGDIPVGSKVRFMKANFDRLTNAASEAAFEARLENDFTPRLALLISCVGRKLILQSRTEEEVEAVAEIFNNKTLLTGFYSYGEISPLVPGNGCQLHNQTMTITAFYEAE